MDVYNQLALVVFKDKLDDLIDTFEEKEDEGNIEEQDIRELKSLVFEEVLKAFYDEKTAKWYKELEDNV